MIFISSLISSSKSAPLLMISMFSFNNYLQNVCKYFSIVIIDYVFWLTSAPFEFPSSKKESLNAEQKQKQNPQKFIFYITHMIHLNSFNPINCVQRSNIRFLLFQVLWCVCVPMSTTLWNMNSKFKRLNVKHPLCRRMCIWAVEVF